MKSKPRETCPKCKDHNVVEGETWSVYGDPKTGDRKSTRLNSSHSQISYAVFCLKKKKKSQNSSNSYISNARFTLRMKQSRVMCRSAELWWTILTCGSRHRVPTWWTG